MPGSTVSTMPGFSSVLQTDEKLGDLWTKANAELVARLLPAAILIRRDEPGASRLGRIVELIAEEADVLVAIGTTLTVHPVAGLVPYAFGHSARVVIVNAEETPYDHLADAILREPIADVLPRLVADAAGPDAAPPA